MNSTSSASTLLLRRSMATIANAKAATSSYRVVVIGAGSAGLAVASQLARQPAFADAAAKGKKEILVVDPADVHIYQPLWTFVGAGLKKMAESKQPMAAMIPSQADWLKSRVSKVIPQKNVIVSDTGAEVKYDFLVVAPGIQTNWGKIEGLVDALEDPNSGVCSNYGENYFEKTAKLIQNFKGGNAIFTQPATPIKCAGAPQKIMYLAEEAFRKNNVRDKTKVTFQTGMGKIFSVDKYGATLTQICKERGIDVQLQSDLVKLNPATKEAIFKRAGGSLVTLPYDMIHVSPPMGPPSWLKESEGLTNADGWVEVDKISLQHVRFPNVFACGDASSLPTSKTAAAAAAQAGVLVWNLSAALEGRAGGAEYNGYTSCPLITGTNKLVLAEFDYNLKPRESFFFNQGVERSSMYYLTAEVIPAIYWKGMMKGLWSGPGAYRMFTNPFGSN
ncbi:hypothetical protein HDU76_005211 [Blyttiomyces sp. JEL0837]|nr:hypothetical protein HDU76_005211 [Blyttiomyces sp. JEL0837]